jgi:hypothetical protein
VQLEELIQMKINMEQVSWLGKNRRTIVGLALGAVGGFLYWRFVGCTSGHCPISSNPFISTTYGGLLGYLFIGMISKEKAKTKI